MKKIGLCRICVVITAVLTALSITLTGVARSYAQVINDVLGIQTVRLAADEGADYADTVYFKSAYTDLNEMYAAKAQLVREVGQEGTILLKNNGVLPLTSGKVTVLNGEAFLFALATGGGSAKGSTPCTTLSAALQLDGLTVSAAESDAASSDAVIVVIARSAGEGADLPDGRLALTAEELAMLERAKTACSGRVIMLISGDFSPEIADQHRDDGIGAILRIGNAGFRGALGTADVITGRVSPSGHLVETMAVDSHSSPAMVNFGDFKYENSAFIEASQAKTYVVYREGIYYDYRYYETRYEDTVLRRGNADSSVGTFASPGGWSYADEVLYPFGYGLSYTDFTREFVDDPVFNREDRTATLTVKVTNTGSTPGKDVVQIYAQSPYTDYDRENLVEKAAVQLMGFAKTKTIAPGESETVTVTVHLQWLASYDYLNAKTFIMDAGDYYFALGNGAHEALNNILAAKGMTAADGMTAEGSAAMTLKWTQQELDTVTFSTSVYTGADVTNAFADADINYWLEEGEQVTYLTRSAWDATWPAALKLKASQRMIDCLNDVKKYENGIWNDTASRVQAEAVSYKTDSSSPVSVLALRGLSYDDEAWNTILDNMNIEEMSDMVANGRSSIRPAPSVLFPGCTGGDSPTGLSKPYLYSRIDPVTGECVPLTAEDTVSDGITEDRVNVQGVEMTSTLYTSIPTLAATFNVELARRQGEMFGEDALYSGCAFIWGSGCNIHRTPYGGRATEYYSADPILTTLMASAQTVGAAARGAVLVNKHFCVNEQEQNRIGVATFINEQTLREIEARAFEGTAAYGGLRGIMASYNRLGLIGTASEYDLMTTLLREEWGSSCYVITDLNGPTAGLYDGNAVIAAGTSTMLNNGPYDNASGAYVNTTLHAEKIKRDPVLLYQTREACHRMLYAYVNSAAMNGMSSNTRIEAVIPWWSPVLTGMDWGFGALTVLFSLLYLISCSRSTKKEEK